MISSVSPPTSPTASNVLHEVTTTNYCGIVPVSPTRSKNALKRRADAPSPTQYTTAAPPPPPPTTTTTTTPPQSAINSPPKRKRQRTSPSNRTNAATDVERAERALRTMYDQLDKSRRGFERSVNGCDEGRFVRSFEPHETTAIRSFLGRYGFVCVRVLERDVCDTVARRVVESVAKQAGDDVRPWQWKTYLNGCMPEGFTTGVLEGTTKKDWTSAGGSLDAAASDATLSAPPANVQQAVIGSIDFSTVSDTQLLERLPLRVDRLTHSEPLWRARTNPALYRVFADLLQTSRLYCSLGAIHFMRPKRARPTTVFQEWRNHLKTTFWERPPADDRFAGFFGLQVMTDATVDDGGLELVPGFHFVYDSWLQLQHNVRRAPQRRNVQSRQSPGFGAEGRVLLPKRPYAVRLVNGFLQRIPVRAGTVIIVDRRLPFRTFPSNSRTQPFVAQEVTMFPQPTNVPSVDAAARRLRCLSIQHGVRFTTMPIFTGHTACTWARWRREVRNARASEQYTLAPLSPLGECLLGTRPFDATLLRNLDLPVYDDLRADVKTMVGKNAE